MATIVAGRFDTFADAERAARGLYGHGLSVSDVSIFTVSPAERDQPMGRPAGVLLAAHATEGRIDAVADLIRAEGGRDLETAEGRWEHGRWADFDPMTRPRPLAARPPEHRASQLGEGALSPTGNEDPGSEIDQSIAESGRGHETGAGTGQSGEAGAVPTLATTPGPDDDVISEGDRPRAEAQMRGEPRQAGAPPRSGAPAGERHSGAAGQGPVSGGQGADARHPADEQPREAWEAAASHRQPGDPDPGPQLVRGHTTTPEPRGPNDTPRQMRRGQFPPGIGEGELRDPGSTTPGSPKVDNRS
ncbi:hypothetical protein L602_000400000840 [Cupriavidus gilardii J11]|uniref:Uncharacterized protein n=1 Tax=Cupriavidus gilardii J11 TaxID=936133 RepID=A0A562B9A5_9BURK|nr:hypothetical protein [Cupriavidus gilardii]TWG81765.1 hypothetical protein L602_000400000840 [Cupriavidus gilardii J11]